MKTKIYLVIFTLAMVVICQTNSISQTTDKKQSTATTAFLSWKGAWPYGPAEAMDADSLRNLVFMSTGGAVAILDVSNPAEPLKINDDVRTRGYVEDICYVYDSELLILACVEGGMDIWEVSDPQNPELLSRTELYYGGVEVPVWNIDVEGDYAIAACDWGLLHSIDISHPGNPEDVYIAADQGDEAHNVHISSDGYVHVSGDEHYQRYTLNPDGSLTDAGYYGYYTYGPYEIFGTPEAIYYDLQGDLIILNANTLYPYTTIDLNGVSDILVRGSYAYINNEDGFNIYDVSDPEYPEFVGNHPINSYNGYQITVFDQYAFIADRTHGMMVLDISDPANPDQIGTYDDTPLITSVEQMGDHAYMSDFRGSLQIIDVNPPDSTVPERIGEILTDGNTYDVALQGDFAYIADWEAGMKIINISDPSNPVETGSESSIDAWRVKVMGNYAFFIEAIPNEAYKIWSYDVTDKSNPLSISSLLMPAEVNEFYLKDNLLYCAGGESGTHIIDVSNPEDMVIIGEYPSPDALDVFVKDTFAYVLNFDYNNNQDFTGALEVIDISDPSNPSLAGDYFNNQFSPWDIYVEGEYAFITEGAPNNVVMMFNVADPDNIFVEDEFDTPGGAVDVMAYQGLIYLCDGETGLQILEREGAPIAIFEADQTTIDIGQTVQFTDMSAGDPTGWEWTFEGGTPETSTEQNPSVTYNQAGAFDVSLTVTNNFGSNTTTQTNYINVMPEDQHWEFLGGLADPVYTIYISTAILDGIDLEFGDELAVFDGNRLCGHLFVNEVFKPEDLFDHPLMAFSTTVEGNGYDPGNPVMFKCWDVSEQTEAEYVNFNFSDPYGDAWMQEVFPLGDGDYSIIDLSFESGGEQSITFNTGYQFVSSHIIPPNPDMTSICEDLMMDETLDFARNSEGNMLQKIGPEWVNNIGDWNTTEGYLFKMFADDNINISGSYISRHTTLALAAGYTFISYFPHYSLDALEAVDVILDNLDFMRDSEGNSLNKIGPEWINNIGNMEPGEGYLIRMNGGDSLFYPPEGNEIKLLADDETAYYRFSGGNPADPVFTLYIEPGTAIGAGDEVAAWKDGKLLGACKLTGQERLHNDLIIFSTLLDGKGYGKGKPIKLSLYDISEDTEYDLNWEPLPSYPDAHTEKTYPTGDGKYGIIKIQKGAEKVIPKDGLTLYPNPSPGMIDIQASDLIKRLCVYNNTGKMIIEGFPGNDKGKIDLSGMESGIYLLRIYTAKKTISRKVIIE